LARYLDIANQIIQKKRKPKSSRVGKIQNILIMKKITLLVASIFLFGGIVANAAERNHRKSPVDFSNAEPIVFTERGVEFFIFADGQLDFNTRPSKSKMYNKSGRRNVVNTTYGTRGNRHNGNYGVAIEHDHMGRVRRVGNLFINYDANNRVKRVGSVYMNYNRYALSQVGGLKIIYNHHGQIVDFVGNVNRGVAFQNYSHNNEDNDHDYINNSNDYNDHGNNQNNTNQDNIYYKTRNTKPNKVVANLGIRIKS